MCRLWIMALVWCLGLAFFTPDEPQAKDGLAPSVAVVHDGGAEWIAISGQIGPQSVTQLRGILARLNGRKLPVIINSPGGRLTAALQLGRLIRSHKLDVVVGETRFLSASTAMLVPGSGSCNSACPFVLAGGVGRYSSAGTTVGVHQALLVRRGGAEARQQIRGQHQQLVRQSAANAQAFRAMRASLRAYLAEMGVSTGLAAEMEKAPPSAMNILPASRQRELGLITAELSAGDFLALASGVERSRELSSLEPELIP